MAPIVAFFLLVLISYVSVLYIPWIIQPSVARTPSPMPRGGAGDCDSGPGRCCMGCNQTERRLVIGENVLSGHRLHFFQQLVIGGYKHGTISALYIFLTFLTGPLTYESMHGDAVAPFLIFMGLSLIWILLLAHAARISRAQ